MLGLEIYFFAILIFCIVAAAAFEFINGFHDTANAVATVIYTNSLRPYTAVILSGTLNFIGVFVGGIGVAMGIINLLPMEALLDNNLMMSSAVILSILLSAIIWNLGTWYYGIPCSSSHTLIGSILGMGMAYSLYASGNIANVPWDKAGEIGISLLISPLFGFLMAALLMMLIRNLIRSPHLFEQPPANTPPPWWIRTILILTCSGVSFSHGSNDGQKGVGLVMLILISFLPTYYALDSSQSPKELHTTLQNVTVITQHIRPESLGTEEKATWAKAKTHLNELRVIMENSAKNNYTIADDQKIWVRKNISYIYKNLTKLNKSAIGLSEAERKQLGQELKSMEKHIAYAPFFVFLLISISLGLGTMVGWKRIVVTIGEKIGKEHLTYAQGASSELVAASTIGVSTFLALPVSTTHVLSSGIAGSMVANKGLSNLQGGTIKNIAIAWLLTLPVCIFLSFSIFYLLTLFI